MSDMHKMGLTLAPFPFECKFCKKLVDTGALLDRGKGHLDLVCMSCANLCIYTEQFILPASVPGLTFNNLIHNIEST